MIKKTYREKRKKTLNEVKPIPNIKGNHVNLNRKSHVERKSFLHLKQLWYVYLVLKAFKTSKEVFTGEVPENQRCRSSSLNCARGSVTLMTFFHKLTLLIRCILVAQCPVKFQKQTSITDPTKRYWQVVNVN